MLTLDANILVRAALGSQVRAILRAYTGRIRFIIADFALEEARFHIPRLLLKRGNDPNEGVVFLDGLRETIDVISVQEYQTREPEAKQRIAARDISDWPTVAVALNYGCPI